MQPDAFWRRFWRTARLIGHRSAWGLGLAAALAVPGCAATYYVNFTEGNDNNAGTSPLAPWRYSPGMSAYSGSVILRPGDTVYFDRRGTWDVTGQQGLYLTGGVTYVGDSWAADGLAQGRATIRAAAGLDAGVVRFRDHPTQPTVLRGFNIDANHRVATGIDINHRYWQLMNGAVKRVENVDVGRIASRQANGEYKYGIAVSNWGGDAGLTENVEILNATVHDISRDAIVLYPGDGVQDRVGKVLIRGCEVFNTGQDPGYYEGHGIVVKGWVYDSVIENCYVHNVNSSAVFFSGPENNGSQRGAANVHVRNNILTTQDDNGIIRLYKKGAKDLKVYNNLLLNNSQTGGLSLDGNSGGLTLLVYHNTFYSAFVDLGSHASTVQRFDFINNIVVFPGTQLRRASAITHLASNLLQGTNPGLKNPAEVPTGFIGTFGIDLRPNTEGYSLLPASAALDAATSLGSPFASSINSVARPSGLGSDIGAYESGSALSPPTSLSAFVE
ncbi:MAG: right-handed parallel beta-helix repeat-containing protein [Bryobacterales bacterium]|nr:right-handed parallel beta-helix repeat-containing protein [Bryobacterales bacterium]